MVTVDGHESYPMPKAVRQNLVEALANRRPGVGFLVRPWGDPNGSYASGVGM